LWSCVGASCVDSPAKSSSSSISASLRSMRSRSGDPAIAGRHIDLLEREGVHLGEPYTRQLRGKLRELRFGSSC
jgi:hypothetical protein